MPLLEPGTKTQFGKSELRFRPRLRCAGPGDGQFPEREDVENGRDDERTVGHENPAGPEFDIRTPDCAETRAAGREHRGYDPLVVFPREHDARDGGAIV